MACSKITTYFDDHGVDHLQCLYDQIFSFKLNYSTVNKLSLNLPCRKQLSKHETRSLNKCVRI